MVVENKVIIDWLSVTSKIYSVADMMDLIGMSGFPWVQTKGAHGYRSRMYYDHISIHFDGNDSVWLEMSGQGCRVFESFGNGDYKRIFDLCADFGDDFHLTRLDVAYDDLVRPEQSGEICSGILDMKQLCSDTLAGNFISRSTEWQVVQSSKGASIGVGSMKSDVYIRIYDKAAERGYTDGTHWIRVELQLRNSRALEFSKIDLPIGQAFCGVLLNYLRYLEPNPNDSNKSRWDIAQYWMNVIDDASAISIYVKPGTEYNMLRCENYVFNLAGNAVDALIEFYGTDKFVEKLGKRTTKPNPKYQFMLDLARRENDFHDEKILDFYKSQLDDISPPQREKHYDVVDYDKNDIFLQEYIAELRRSGKLTTDIGWRTVYNYIYSGILSGKHIYKPRKKRSEPRPQRQPRHGVSIDLRPDVINSRISFGHWEGDSVIGRREKGETLFVLTERKTRQNIILRSHKLADQTSDAFLNLKKQCPEIFKSITFDNGSEFSRFDQIEHTGTDVYFCHPYSSWERGSNEKQNQMIRRKIKKGSKIENYSDAQIRDVQTWLNNYPREMFGMRSSADLFSEECAKIGVKMENLKFF